MSLVSIQEAVRILGVSDATIRRRIRNGTLKGHKVPSPRGEAWRVEVPDAPREASTPASARLSSGSSPKEMEVLRSLVTTLKLEVDSRRQEVQQLHVLLGQALDLPPGPRREAMSHEAKKVEPFKGATQLERYCSLRAAVEEILVALKAKEVDGVVMWAKALVEMLDAEIAPYGDEGRETYAAIREAAAHIKREQFLDRSHNN